MSVKELTDKNFEDVKKSKRAIVKFYADWCNPCQMLKPIYHEVSDKIPEVDFYSINVDKAEKIADRYGVMSVPTMILLVDGDEKDRIVGVSDTESLLNEIRQKFNL